MAKRQDIRPALRIMVIAFIIEAIILNIFNATNGNFEITDAAWSLLPLCVPAMAGLTIGLLLEMIFRKIKPEILYITGHVLTVVLPVLILFIVVAIKSRNTTTGSFAGRNGPTVALWIGSHPPNTVLPATGYSFVDL